VHNIYIERPVCRGDRTPLGYIKSQTLPYWQWPVEAQASAEQDTGAEGAEIAATVDPILRPIYLQQNAYIYIQCSVFTI